MKKLMTILMVVAICGAAQASTAINFDAVALRPADDGSGYGTITEYANGNGATVQTLQGGQKVYYGTEYFDGWAVNKIDYIEFTYEKISTDKNAPYINMVIHDASDNYGIISSQGGSPQWTTTVSGVTTTRMRYYFSGNSGNSPFGFRFYEPSPDAGSWGHGTNLVWSDISSWTLLDVGVARPLYSTEVQFGSPSPRGPVDHGLAILWGDSASNYIGDREIYDVVVRADGIDHVAVPLPAAVWAGMMMMGSIGGVRVLRKKLQK